MSFIVFSPKDEKLYTPIDRLLNIEDNERIIIESVRENAWERCIYCFSHINNSKFNTGGIQPYHCVQYGMWLYFLGNEIFRKYPSDENAVSICDKIFMVNMSITQMDLFYGHNMPEIFCPTHTSGVVFSPMAQIGEYFLFSHGCNIGLNKSPQTPPVLGKWVRMLGHSKILGNCHVGDYVVFGANSYIKDMDIPDHSIVFGQYPNVIIKEDKNNKAEEIIRSRFII